jgi:hypothetical protein
MKDLNFRKSVNMVMEGKGGSARRAGAFLSAATDNEPHTKKHREHVEAAISKHHPEWTTRTARHIGRMHYAHSVDPYSDSTTHTQGLEHASKKTGIHPELHKALMHHQYDFHGKDIDHN